MHETEKQNVLEWIGRHPKTYVEEVIRETGVDRYDLYLLVKEKGFNLPMTAPRKAPGLVESDTGQGDEVTIILRNILFSKRASAGI